MLKRFGRNPALRRMAARAAARWLRFVRWSCREIVEPADTRERALALQPLIVAMWHGEHNLVAFARPEGMPFRAMISRSGDGELAAMIVRDLGVEAIRASGGTTDAQIRRRGGVLGVLAAVKALAEGTSVVMTADVPKGPAKVAGLGIVAIARKSGRPILPVAIATTHNIRIGSWDSAAFNLPFGRMAIVAGEPIGVPADADAPALEAARRAVETGLETATDRAYALAGGRRG